MVLNTNKELCSIRCTLITFGAILTSTGLVLAIFWEMIFESILYSELKLTPTSKSYEPWKQPPMPLSLDIYLFNWTNPEDIRDNETKPVLEELGPYRFTEIPDKVDIVWNRDNSTVSYRKKSLFYFDEVGSVGSLDDEITSINVVALSATARAKHWNYVGKKSVSIGLKLYEQDIHVTKTARELLFEGYEDMMVLMGKEIFKADEVPFDRVGWFYMRNNTPDLIGHYNVHTGEEDITKIGTMQFWNYASRTNFFDSYCGMINGSAGEFYPPHQQKDVPVQFFSPDMCRTLPFDFEQEVEVEGVLGYKYTGGARTVDNGSLYPENSCFYPGENVPSGVLNISSCRFGTPVFMSFPHFYNADPYYVNQVDGLNPTKEKHEFSLTLEPYTGIALDVAARFQLNVLIQPDTHISLYEDVQKIFLPVLWFEQRVTMTKDVADEISVALSVPIYGQMIGVVILIIGLSLIFLYLFKKILCLQQRRIKDVEESVKFQPNVIDKKNQIAIKEMNPSNGCKLKFEGLPLIDENDQSSYDVKLNTEI
uniref:Putative plasma membrane glycoprotein cd36 n=1 Tax=Corethrella appendiculata TaxID=1370023 RepID=U5EUH2_9DIPT